MPYMSMATATTVTAIILIFCSITMPVLYCSLYYNRNCNHPPGFGYARLFVDQKGASSLLDDTLL